MADDRNRREDEETSEHQVAGLPTTQAGGWQAPVTPPPAQPPAWQPPGSTAPSGNQWQQPGTPGQPGWGEQQGWREQPASQPPASGQYPGWTTPGNDAWDTGRSWPQQPPSWTGPAPYGSAGRAIAAAVILLIYGIPALLFGGLVTLVALSAGDEMLDELRRGLEQQGAAGDFDLDAMLRLVMIFFGIAFVLGIVHVAAAIGILAHKSWGRVLGIVVSILGIMFGLLLLIPSVTLGDPGSLIFGSLVALGYGIALFGLASGGIHFRRLDAGRW